MSIDSRQTADRLRREHEELLDAEKKLRGLLASCQSSPAARADLGPAAREFSEHLLRHFQYEEQGGFMQPVLEQDPAFATRVDTLRREHDRMRRQLRTIARDLARRAAEPEELHLLLDDFRRLFRELHAHEHSESALMLDAFWTDEAAGD